MAGPVYRGAVAASLCSFARLAAGLEPKEPSPSGDGRRSIQRPDVGRVAVKQHHTEAHESLAQGFETMGGQCEAGDAEEIAAHVEP